MKHLLKNLYKGRLWERKVNWEYLYSIPEFNILNFCEQNPKWHSEGNVMEHTKLAIKKFEDEVLDSRRYCWFSNTERFIIRASIILHDIGKGVTTEIGKDGNWHSYGHEIEGEKIARILLWNEDITIRETICSLIRYHMEPLRIFDSKNWIHRIIEIGYRVPWKMLYCVKMADLLGSVQVNGGTMKEDLQKLELIKKCAISLGVWDNAKNQDYKDLVKYGNNKNILPWKVNYDTDKNAYILIGLPGAGKNTIIEDKTVIKEDNFVHISRDDIREELSLCLPGEKYLGTQEEEERVTNLYEEKLKNAMFNGKTIILNNTHLKKKYREASTKPLRENGYNIIYVYVEAPTLEINYKRRDGQIPSNSIKSMALKFEFPEPCEYDKLIIKKQTL